MTLYRIQALGKVALTSDTLAVAGIVVYAKDAAATRFYQRFGFLSLPGQAQRLLLPEAAFRSD